MSSLSRNARWKQTFQAAVDRPGIDFVNKEGSIIVKVNESNQGLDSFHADIMRLAKALASDSKIERACLLISTTKLSMERIRQEWAVAKRLFTPSISRRLGLLAHLNGITWIEPEDIALRWMATVFEESALKAGKPLRNFFVQEGERYVDVTKLMLIRWLRQEGPIVQKQLAQAVGCSYPTIRDALSRLEKRGYLLRHKDRQVELAGFPYEVWQEILALSFRLRQNIALVDASRSDQDPQMLFKRLKQQHPNGVALGGVLAARRWHPRFNLHGIPRLDITVHVPDRYLDLSFIQKLDPALREVTDNRVQPILVLHPLHRAVPYFTEKPHDLPIADPVETALDLVEMGLTQQANDLFHHFRKEVRLT